MHKERPFEESDYDEANLPFGGFIASATETTGMIPAIFDDDMLMTYGAIFSGVKVLPEAEREYLEAKKYERGGIGHE